MPTQVDERLNGFTPDESALPLVDSPTTLRPTGRGISNFLNTQQVFHEIIPQYWSRDRDRRLRQWALGNDYLLIAVYNAITAIAAILPTIQPIDKDNQVSRFESEVATLLLQRSWIKEIYPFLFDVLTTDNGGFMEVIGGGPPDGPLEPVEITPGFFMPAVGFNHLDSLRVWRTDSDIFPITYEHLDGVEYKIHHTRLIEYSQMSSPDVKLNGVGVCALTRMLNNILQMTEYDDLLLGMLTDGLVGEIIFGSPFKSDDLAAAYREAEARALQDPNPKMRRFVFVGVKNFEGNMQIERIPLRRIPEGFEKAESVNLMMNLAASALGMDIRTIWHSTVSGATRADAEVSHRKTRSKFTREWINKMTLNIDQVFAPLSGKTQFDWVDLVDILEKIGARKELAESHKIEIENGTMTVGVAVEQMFESGFLTLQEFEAVKAELARPTLQAAQNLFPRVQSGNGNGQPVQRVLQKQDDESIRDQYEDDLVQLIRAFKSGELGTAEFKLAVDDLTRQAMLEAFLIGSKKDFDDLGQPDFEALRAQLAIMEGVLDDFVELVDDEEDEDVIIGRSNLWGNTIIAVREAAKLFQFGDPLLRWNINRACKNCSTCLGLAGTIRRRSEWLAANLFPRVKGPILDCGGWRCCCHFSEVEEAVPA